MDLNLPQTRPGLVRKIHFCEVAISRMLTFTQILHSGIFLILSHFYFPIYSISSFHIVFGQNIYICTVLPNLGRFLTIPPIIVVIIVIVIFFYYYYLSLQPHLQETTYLPGFRCSGITTLLSEIIKLLMMMIRIRRRRRKRSRRRRIMMTTLLSEKMGMKIRIRGRRKERRRRRRRRRRRGDG